MRTTVIAVAAGLLPLGAYAHHGWSSFDASRAVRITDKLDVKRENRDAMSLVAHEVENTEVHLAPTRRMVSHGVDKEAPAAGKTATIEAHPSPANADESRAERITVDGKTIELP